MMNHGSEKTCCETGGERCCRLDSFSINHLVLLISKDSFLELFIIYFNFLSLITIIQEGLSEALEAPSTFVKGRRLHIA